MNFYSLTGPRIKLLRAGKFSASFYELLLCVIVVALFGSAMADSAEDFDRRFYGGFGLGVSDLDPESMCPCLTVGDGSDQAFSVFLGADLSRHLTLEGYYADLGEAGIRFNGADVGTVGYQVAGISVLGYLFASRLQYSDDPRPALSAREGMSAYIRLGVGVMENDSRLSYDRDHKVHQHAGLGLEYGWANGLALRAEVVSYDSDAAFAGVSILKRFGRNPPPPSPIENTQFTAITDPQKVIPVEPVPDLLEEYSTNYFAFGKYKLTPQTRSRLDKLLVQLLEVESDIIAIEGHTDEIDTEEFNLVLSIKRATAVRDYLVSKGVEPSRLQIEGFGETRPIATNMTLEGRRLNRRVEISLR